MQSFEHSATESHPNSHSDNQRRAQAESVGTASHPEAASYEVLRKTLTDQASVLSAHLERAPDGFPGRAMLLQLMRGFNELLTADDSLDDAARLDRARESLFRVFDLGDAAARAAQRDAHSTDR
jgi:hypothetical protein